MQVTINEGIGSLEQYAGEESNQQDLIFLSSKWFEVFEQHIPASDKQAKSIVFTEDDKVAAVLPALEKNQQIARLFSHRTLHSLSNYYSPVFDLWRTKGNLLSIEDTVDVAADYLKQYDRIDLLPMTEDVAGQWQTALNDIGFNTSIYQHTINWYHDEIQSVDHYWSERPSRLVNTLKRKAEKLRKEGGYEFKIVEPANESELIACLADYHNVYFDSWKKIEPHPGFIDAVCVSAWKQGTLRLGLAYFDGLPVAGQIWFVNGTTASIFKLAHRRSFSEKSVGTILTARLVDFVISEDKVDCIDFLTGDDDYKKDWMTKRRPLCGIQACNRRTLTGLFNSAINHASALRHRWLAKRSD